MQDKKMTKFRRKIPTYFRLRLLFTVFAVALCVVFGDYTGFGVEPSKQIELGKDVSSKHVAAGLKCSDCHETKTPESLKTEQCLSCHGSFEEVAEATKKLVPDPHNSPHYGSELDCDLCHHEHSKSENFCAQCLLVP